VTCWRRVQPFTRSVGRLLDQRRKYLRHRRQVKCSEARFRRTASRVIRDRLEPAASRQSVGRYRLRNPNDVRGAEPVVRG
jgi:hypothetical protein